jgi:hypothetical protein
MILPGFIDKATDRRTTGAVMYIIELATQAISEHNDGYVRERAKQQLIEIEGYINNVLAELEGDNRDVSRN